MRLWFSDVAAAGGYQQQGINFNDRRDRWFIFGIVVSLIIRFRFVLFFKQFDFFFLSFSRLNDQEAIIAISSRLKH